MHLHLPGWRARQALRRGFSLTPWGAQRVHVEPYTFLSNAGLRSLEKAARLVVKNNVPGDLVECGVGEGGSALLMAMTLRRLGSGKRVHLLDTFKVLPEATVKDPASDKAVAWTGKCRGELKVIEELFAENGVLDRTHFIQGMYQDTVPRLKAPTEIALLHIDCDWYDSVKVCLEHLWDRVSPGGIVQFDHYGFGADCRTAADEFFNKRGISAELRVIDASGRQLTKR